MTPSSGPPPSWAWPSSRRRERAAAADAFLELLRAGRGSVAAGVAGTDLYTLHLVADVDAVADRFGLAAELFDGTPIGSETLRRLSCVCGAVRHLFRGRSEHVPCGRDG